MAFTYEPTLYNDRAPRELVPLLINLFHPQSVIDVGCGQGDWLNVFTMNGVKDIYGIDQSQAGEMKLAIDQSKYSACDLCKPVPITRRFDLALCLEVAEHLSGSCANQLIETLTHLSDTIIFSAAIPGQEGQGHINTQTPEYWEKLFIEKGFHFFDVLRHQIWNNPNIHWFYRQNIFVVSNRTDLVFKNDNTPQSNLYVHPELFYAHVRQAAYLAENKGVRNYWRLLLRAIKIKVTGKKKEEQFLL